MTYFMKGKDENSSHPQQQPTNNNPQKSNLPSIPNYNPSEQQRSTTVIKIDQSYLSNYGTKSLGYNERDIYNKQNKNFNIISLKPKQYNETIKQYPKFSL